MTITVNGEVEKRACEIAEGMDRTPEDIAAMFIRLGRSFFDRQLADSVKIMAGVTQIDPDFARAMAGMG
jgi:predicted transcriptional regulator